FARKSSTSLSTTLPSGPEPRSTRQSTLFCSANRRASVEISGSLTALLLKAVRKTVLPLLRRSPQEALNRLQRVYKTDSSSQNHSHSATNATRHTVLLTRVASVHGRGIGSRG